MDFVEGSPAPVFNEEKKPEVKLVDVVVTDENVALNVLVSFVHFFGYNWGQQTARKVWKL
jgi:hypothetical protein